MDRSATPSSDHPTRQERTSEVVTMIQQAQTACRAAGSNLGDARGEQLFEKIASYLDAAIQALQAYQREAPPPPRRVIH